MLEAAGEITIEVRFAAALLTVRLAVDFKVPDCAVMVTVPEADPVAMPVEATLAIVASDELHCTVLVTSFEVPSDILAVAVNCCVAPLAIDMEVGATWTEEIVGAGVLLDGELLDDVPLLVELPPPQPAMIARARNRAAHTTFFIKSPGLVLGY